LIIAAQKSESVVIDNLPKATDVTILINALKEIGLNLEVMNDRIVFNNSFPQCEVSQVPTKVIEVGEGGTTARFLASLLLRGKNSYILKLGSRLKERPWDEFISFANQYGASCSLTDDELFIQGPVHLPSELEVDCTRTTQYATGLALCFYESTKIIPVNLVASQSYWEMSLRLIEDFKNLKKYTTPIDWSSASYSLAFAALNQETFFPHLQMDPFQADAKFYTLLDSLGMLTQEKDGVKIHPKKVHQNIKMDVTDCLDLVPTLVYFLSYIDGTHELIGVDNLVYKESDRLGESLRILEAFKVKHSVVGNTLSIKGEDVRCASKVDLVLPDDHRMVMSASLFMRHNSGGTVSPKEAVNKSYPEFFELFN